MDKKQLLDLERLQSVHGGDAFDDFCKGMETLGKAFVLIDEAAKSNTCPYCNQQIIAGAAECTPNEALKHIAELHGEAEQ